MLFLLPCLCILGSITITNSKTISAEHLATEKRLEITNDAIEPSYRVVNGYEVNIAEMPYQAILRRKVSGGWSHYCGAVVIHKRACLTAAHCGVGYERTPSNLRLVVGTSYRLSGGTTYYISQIILHEYYSGVTYENDIAMVWTNKSIEFSSSVMPIRIPSSQMNRIPAGTVATVSGYGSTSYEGSASQTLQAAQVRIVSQQECLRAYLLVSSVASGMICAAASDPPRDACQGDSGGPLAVDNVLIGIVSWGEGCANPSYPGVYTRVSAYHDWINTWIESLSSLD